MKNTLYNRIMSGETTYKDAYKFRIFQIGFFVLAIILVAVLVIK